MRLRLRGVKRFVVLLYRYGERASERTTLSSSATRVNILWFQQQQPAPFRTYTYCFYNARSRASSYIHFKLSHSLTSPIALWIGNNEANKNAIICIIYNEAPRLLFVPRAHEAYIYILSLFIILLLLLHWKAASFPSCADAFDISIIEVSAPALINWPCLVSG